jgi:hypothetical protein
MEGSICGASLAYLILLRQYLVPFGLSCLLLLPLSSSDLSSFCYQVVAGAPNSLLKDLIVSPSEILFRDSKYRLNHIYYLTKQINPALDRVLHFCGIDIKTWYSQMPKPSSKWTESVLNHRKHIIGKQLGLLKPQTADSTTTRGAEGGGIIKLRQQQPTIREYLPTVMCLVCGNELEAKSHRGRVVNSSAHRSLDHRYLCIACSSAPVAALNSLISRENFLDRKEQNHRLVCRCCSGFQQIEQLFVLSSQESHDVIIGKECCVSTDCPVLFERVRNAKKREDLRLSILAVSKTGTS